MAFGKKKDETAGVTAAEADDDAPLFPDEEPEGESAPSSAPDAVTQAAAPEPPAAPTPAEAAVPSADSLLSAFQTTEGGEEDRSVLLDLAGDVELADLLEELNTLAAAIGVVRA